jgi:hypothetical protein
MTNPTVGAGVRAVNDENIPARENISAAVLALALCGWAENAVHKIK